MLLGLLVALFNSIRIGLSDIKGSAHHVLELSHSSDIVVDVLRQEFPEDGPHKGDSSEFLFTFDDKGNVTFLGSEY